ncbi:2-deoxyribose-5-phosphate aldolase [Thermocatellispora tengchongensis]|uniref:2-deoxyribose-5-phosphate aldolase n=1 Tax=Thermocatellispora tengchongensis TaxID=1073253 RepID=UPI003624BC0B
MTAGGSRWPAGWTSVASRPTTPWPTSPSWPGWPASTTSSARTCCRSGSAPWPACSPARARWPARRSVSSGGATTRTKLAEAGELLEAGAGELDVVIAVGRLRSGDSEYVRRELAQVVALVDGAVPLRAIIEVGHLDDREIGEATRAAVDAGVPWVKTGTGWSGVPTTEHHVRLIAEAARGRAGIKAAGGIRDVATIRAMEALGVARFGMNARAAIAAVAAYDERAEVAR